jgi:hypothetical protein
MVTQSMVIQLVARMELIMEVARLIEQIIKDIITQARIGESL